MTMDNLKIGRSLLAEMELGTLADRNGDFNFLFTASFKQS